MILTIFKIFWIIFIFWSILVWIALIFQLKNRIKLHLNLPTFLSFGENFNKNWSKHYYDFSFGHDILMKCNYIWFWYFWSPNFGIFILDWSSAPKINSYLQKICHVANKISEFFNFFFKCFWNPVSIPTEYDFEFGPDFTGVNFISTRNSFREIQPYTKRGWNIFTPRQIKLHESIFIARSINERKKPYK